MKIGRGNFKVGEGKKMMDEWTSHPVRHLVRLLFLLGHQNLKSQDKEARCIGNIESV
jgi:hypothetical protein